MGRRNRRDTPRGPVDRGWFHGRRAALAFACIGAGFGVALNGVAVSAHGGTATLQLGAERINPGGTIEVIGDMTSDDPVDLALVADDGAVRPIAVLTELDDGHFHAFVAIPAEAPGGSYTVTARNDIELASAPVVLAGPPITDGEQGQRPGQDEPFAGARVLASDTPDALTAGAEPAAVQIGTVQRVEPILVGIATVVAAVAVAFGLGAMSRSRTSRRDGT